MSSWNSLVYKNIMYKITNYEIYYRRSVIINSTTKNLALEVIILSSAVAHTHTQQR